MLSRRLQFPPKLVLAFLIFVTLFWEFYACQVVDKDSQCVFVSATPLESVPRDIIPTESRPEVTRKQGFYEYYSPCQDEIVSLAKIMLAEARGESEQGRLEVAYVVLNRVRSQLHPDTINAVIFEPGQFSPITDGSFGRISVSDNDIALAIKALRTFPDDYQATYFMNPKIATARARKWQENKTIKSHTVGNHVFRADINPTWRF